MVALGHKDQNKISGRSHCRSLWHLPIPILRDRGDCTPSLWLPAHSVRAHTGYLLKCWFLSFCKDRIE
eukprot:1151539-Pelagomonas_calceolata.AAC.1